MTRFSSTVARARVVFDGPLSGTGRIFLLRHGGSMHLFQGLKLLLGVLAQRRNRLGMLRLKLLVLVAGVGLDLLDGLSQSLLRLLVLPRQRFHVARLESGDVLLSALPE